ncbi:MAG: pyridoxal-dependent decarboxylase [Bacteroidia bacterium]
MIEQDLKLFAEIAQALLDEEHQEPVVKPVLAQELFQRLNLELNEEGTSEEAFAEALQSLVLQTPRTTTNKFFNQLFGGRNGKAVIGDLLSVMLNNSMYTYKVAGPMVGVEKEVLSNVAKLAGYGPEADGTFAPGGSLANYMGMLMARDLIDPQARFEGSQPDLVLYTSEEAHYSIPKNAAFMGIGRNHVRAVPCNDVGEMLPDALDRMVQEDKAAGKRPFFVNATAGTTVLGAFDPVDALADVCEKHSLWLHVDGAYCGGVIFSERYKGLLKGLERSHSFSFNAHKMLGTPLSCSIIITQNKKHLYDSFSNEASYLYQTDEDAFNLGKTSLQCGRRNDALKLWTLWKAIGTKGLEALVDKQFELADIAREYVRQHPDYELHSFDDSISVCFSYKDLPADQLCTRLYEEGTLMVGHGSFRGKSFVRMVTINPANGREEIEDFFRVVEGA